MDRLIELLEEASGHAADVFGVKTIGAKQDFSNIVIKGMEVLVEAHQNGVNYLKGVRTKGGNVQFTATSGGYQRVDDSAFSGKSGASVGMDKLVLKGRVGTLTDHPEQAGIGLEQPAMLQI